MMPPQAEASLALEYSTDTRKLGARRATGCQPRLNREATLEARPPARCQPHSAHQNMMVATA